VERLLRWARIELETTGAEQMSRRPGRNHSPAFKAKVAIEGLGDGKTVAEIAQKHDVNPNQVRESPRVRLVVASIEPRTRGR
jgi:hypothetical protein